MLEYGMPGYGSGILAFEENSKTHRSVYLTFTLCSLTCVPLPGDKVTQKYIVLVPQELDRMCKSPPCPNDCLAASPDTRTRRQHMYRTYIRVYDAKHRQHSVPVGWWCPGCHAFMDDMR
ncbi:MAG: hypothetical protein LUQ04_06645 [Methanoregula sp.]|nr:hypothetical protein [Methanoregula sp.]